jgi:hypothetical protein
MHKEKRKDHHKSQRMEEKQLPHQPRGKHQRKPHDEPRNHHNHTEDGDGIAFYNPQGTKIAQLDAQGNFYVRGKVVEGLPE